MKFSEMFADAKWITPSESCAAPYLRTGFFIPDFEKISITICGLGYFELYINGKRASDDLFVPLYTDYHEREFEVMGKPFAEKLTHRIIVPKYDITKLIVPGDNIIAIALAPGWYASKPEYGCVKVCYKIDVISSDGSEFSIVSDKIMKWATSPITKYEFITGEIQDLSLEKDGWTEPGYDDSAWANTVFTDIPETDYYIQSSPADRIINRIKPKVIKETETETIYDIGINVSGYPVLKCDSDVPQKIELICGELIGSDNTLLPIAAHGKSIYYTRGISEEFHTRFTWHAYRYFSISKPAYAIESIVIHSDVKVSSNFKSSNKILNWLYEAYIRTQLSNMHGGIPSDCPHLERRGYTGDGQLVCECGMLLLDSKSFYRKWIDDISDCQNRINGHVQYTAPYVHSGGGPGGWGCAIAEVPYMYFRVFGDPEPTRKMLPQMLSYLDYLELHSENDLILSDEPGLWCLGDWCTPDEIKIPEPFVNNYFYIKTINRIIYLCDIFGISEYKVQLIETKRRKEIAIMREYFNAATGDFAGNIQGANAFAVDLSLGDDRTLSHLVENYTKAGMYDTGIFGTDIVTRILFEHGYGELAYSLLTSKKEISFNTIIERGGTTLWEYWTGKRSYSHPMFGAVVKYLFKYLLGINQPVESNGFSSIIISPIIINELTSISGSIMTPKGQVTVSITQDSSEVTVRTDVPEKANAKLVLYGTEYPLCAGRNEITAQIQ